MLWPGAGFRTGSKRSHENATRVIARRVWLANSSGLHFLIQEIRYPRITAPSTRRITKIKEAEDASIDGALRALPLARRIAELAAHESWKSGYHLAEAELGRALGVSRSPVRRALHLLAARGIAQPSPGRGMFLAIDGSETTKLLWPAPPPSGEEQLRGRLLRDHVAGRLPPVVTRGLLLERYAVSRVMLGQAIARLQDEGLILKGEGHALRFAATIGDVAGIRASYEVRLALEPAGLTLQGFRLDHAALTALLARHHAMTRDLRGDAATRITPAMLVALDQDFHLGLIACSGNPFMLAIARQQEELRRLMEFTANEDRSRVAAWLAEHVAVLEDILAGHMSQAAGKLRKHLENALDFTCQQLTRR